MSRPFLDLIAKTGPGWLQGAMTLGGGSAITSLTIGAVYGYEFLWIQPVSMLIGCIMLFALSYQTLSTGERPFAAIRNHVSPILAWLWAIAALGSSIIWGFSHYPLSAGMLEEAIHVATGFSLKSADDALAREIYLFALAVAVWSLCAYTAWRYAEGGRAIRTFETAIKALTGLIILSFAWVVVGSIVDGNMNWPRVFAGFIPSSLPDDGAGVTTLMAALGTAVGINMTFVYGYTLLRRNWGPAERALARADIVIGLVLPYIIVTSLISIAAACVIHDEAMPFSSRLDPATAGEMFAASGLGDIVGRLVFPLGVLGMAVGSLVMHMLTCGAAAQEMFNLRDDSLAYRLSCLLPTPAVAGVFLWTVMGPYVILPTSAICGLLLPIAYVGWFILNNKQSYLGADTPRGVRALVFNTAMLLCIAAVTASVGYSIFVRLQAG